MSGIISRDVAGNPLAEPTITATLARIAGPFHAGRFNCLTFTIYNTGSVALSACKIRSAPWAAEVASPLWKDEDTTTFAALAAGAADRKAFANNAQPYWDVMAQVASGSTTAQVFFNAN